MSWNTEHTEYTEKCFHSVFPIREIRVFRVLRVPVLRYFPSSLIFQAMVIFRKAIFKNIKCCLSGVNRALLVGL
ncbi:Uncharacterised protein [Parabacteroides distasonis]|nr:Uncharacterised protein [Parabacteroides distasonis]